VDSAVLAEHYKSEAIDLSAVLTPSATLRPGAAQRCMTTQDHGLDTALDGLLLERALPVLDAAVSSGTFGEPLVIDADVKNTHRATGTQLSYEISKRFGEAGLPDGSITINLSGHAGQSLGAWLARGVSINMVGDANDYVGKGLSGGVVAVRAPPQAPFVPRDQVIVGNVVLYGAVEGEAYFNGKAAERFCVRNSGAKAVVEGVGDHGCEYMTGGLAVILGPVGKNFGAGMSGGIAYVYDPSGSFQSLCNKDVAGDLERIEDERDVAELRYMLERHVELTASTLAAEILAEFDGKLGSFWKVYPHEYRRALVQLEAERAQEELLNQHDGSDALAALKAATERSHSYVDYAPPPSQGKEIDWAQLLKDASDGWMVNKRVPTWDEGRTTKAGGKAVKARGFVEYERLALPYRDEKERLGDYDEVLAKLNSDERSELLNTQARCHRLYRPPSPGFLATALSFLSVVSISPRVAALLYCFTERPFWRFSLSVAICCLAPLE
jgi:glutamate synthase (NADH)